MTSKWWELPSSKLGRGTKWLADDLGLLTIGDVLRRQPREYVSLDVPSDFSSLVADQDALVVGTVTHAEYKTMGQKQRATVQARLTDGRSSLRVTMFMRSPNAKHAILRLFPVGETVALVGKPTRFSGGWSMTQPIVVGSDTADAQFWATHRTKPIYPMSGPKRSEDFARIVRVAVQTYDLTELPDVLSNNAFPYLDELHIPTLAAALKALHMPVDHEETQIARRRLAFDEALVLQLVLAKRRAETLALSARPFPHNNPALLAAFDHNLPFQLTPGQLHVGQVISDELAQPRPMHRLLQGDVGSGKTVVALRAMLQVVAAGGQCALLAPTEVLAAQHAYSMSAMLGDLARAGQLGAPSHATRLALLTGSSSAADRRNTLAGIADGSVGICVGTHALLSDTVNFANLGLVVIDEQHRFGVDQRNALRSKGALEPHLLTMTATPIPRTVALTAFGHLDVSTLTEAPRGRQPITTHIVAGFKDNWMARVWQLVAEQAALGRQTFVVCPRIGGEADEDDVIISREHLHVVPDPRKEVNPLDLSSAVDLYHELQQQPHLGHLRLAVLHGRLTAEQRSVTMAQFAAGDIDVLVATTVIEVGVDVPNATVMVVMDADRFGVSQLHQLRGRVGRGQHPSLCFLVTKAKVSADAERRLTALAATTDGFELAEMDTEVRREGDILGPQQSGARSSLKALRVMQDVEVIQAARQCAEDLLAEDPNLFQYKWLRADMMELQQRQMDAYLQRS